MKLIPCESSNVAAHGYDEPTKTLMLQFKNSNKVYHYPDVPKEVYHGLTSAKSIGGFVLQHIKGRKFVIK